MKILFFDLETTGTKFWKNGIHQISGCIEIDGMVKESFDFKVKPYHAAVIEDEALAIASVTREDLEKYMEFAECYKQVIAMLGKYVNKFDKKDKFFLAGFNNASFDNPFFRAFFVQNGDQYFGSWFWSSPIDVFILANQFLMGVRHEMENFQQGTVAKQLGIEVDDNRLHDGVYDVEIMMKIYKIVTAPYRVLENMVEGKPQEKKKISKK